jgi:hypothetical protein
MFGHSRTAVKFFVYGLAIGLLFAPRPGDETRRQALAWLRGAADDVMGGGSKD